MSKNIDPVSGKDKGGRPMGSTTRPKTYDELLLLVDEAAKREGREGVGWIMPEPEGASTPPRKNTEREYDKLEIEMDSSEVDTYTCGSCAETLPAPVPICPHCEMGLTWT